MHDARVCGIVILAWQPWTLKEYPEVVAMVNNTESNRSLFAARLTERRKAKPNLTRGALATAIGVEEKHYTRYELGHTEPDYSILVAICRELDCTPNDLLLE